jgi:hypothetical protein
VPETVVVVVIHDTKAMQMRTLIAAVLAFAVCTPVASARTWTDSTGKHTLEAEFVEMKDGKVQLKKEDGKTITIPIEKLSDPDQEFVRSAASRDNPDREVATAATKAQGEPGRSKPQSGTAATIKVVKSQVERSVSVTLESPTVQTEHKEKSEPPTQPKEIVELLDKVKDVSKIENAPRDRVGVFGGMLGYTLGIICATETVTKEGTEEAAINALSKIATDRKDSRNKSDTFICWGVVVALNQFPMKANLVLPILKDLTKHPEPLVSDDAKKTLKDIQKKEGAKPAP